MGSKEIFRLIVSIVAVGFGLLWGYSISAMFYPDGVFLLLLVIGIIAHVVAEVALKMNVGWGFAGLCYLLGLMVASSFMITHHTVALVMALVLLLVAIISYYLNKPAI